MTAIVATLWAAEALTQGASTTPQAVPIPRATFIATMDAEFKKVDADKNGIITTKEVEDFQRAIAGLVAQQRNVALFQALDSDKNGQVSPAEFTRLPMNNPQPNSAQFLGQVDGNRDGKVTLVEYRSGKLVNFDRADADKDGVVSVPEMKAAGIIK
ncbi:MAG: EF-hand domain-containing protein [Sphingomicrobium sp.]